jgi:hypothetical protein
MPSGESIQPSARAAPLVVFGASGLIGRHLATVSGPCERVAVVRRQKGSPTGSIRTIVGDRRQAGTLSTQLPVGAVLVNLAYDSSSREDVNFELADGVATTSWLGAPSCRGLTHTSP